MSTNTLPAQGSLNRLLASVVVPSFTGLNVIPGNLGKRQISLAFEGQATDFIDTQVGAVTSPNPYLKVTIGIDLLKTQSLSVQWRTQMEVMSAIGFLNVIPDSIAFPTYNFFNCAIQGVRELSFAGSDASYMVVVGGYYNVNASMWNLI